MFAIQGIVSSGRWPENSRLISGFPYNQGSPMDRPLGGGIGEGVNLGGV